MALATQCPHCHTTFRVASDQLKLRGGIVRCGTCQRIFDGNAHLIDLEALAARKASEAAQADAGVAAPDAELEAAPAAAQAPVAPSPAFESPVAASPAQDTPAAPADFGAQPVYTLDFDHTFDPLGILPKAEPALDADANAAGTPDRIEPRLDVPADDDTGAPLMDEDVRDAVQADEAVDSPAPEAVPEPGPAPEPEPQAEPAPEPMAAAMPEPAPEPTFAPDSPASVPPTTLEAAVPPEPALPPAASSAPAPAYAYAPAGRIEPSFDLPVDEALVAQPLHGHEPDPEPDLEPHPAPATAIPVRAADAAADSSTAVDVPGVPPAALPLRASADLDAPFAAMDTANDAAAPRSARAKAVDARARRSKLTPTRIEAPRLRVPASAESDEPEFVKRSRRQERSGKSVRILLAAGTAVLLLLLAAQLLIAYRSELALRYPAARPLLNGLCAAAGCRVGLPAKADNLVIDEGELAPIGADTYSLNTTLRNQGSLVQAWPSIELELTDANNKPLLRRVFGPADYLPAGAAGTSAANGFGAHSEQPVRLNFALADIKPSGYHTFVFYP